MTNRGLKATAILGAIFAAIGMLWVSSRMVSKSERVSTPEPGSAPSVVSSPSPNPIDVPSPIPSAAPSVSVSDEAEAEFDRLTARVLSGLPSANSLKQLKTEDVHSHPQIIMNAAASLGEVAKAAGQNPALAARASEFYRQCALGEHPTTVRAFCLARAAHAAGGDPAWAAELPESVRDLSKKVKF